MRIRGVFLLSIALGCVVGAVAAVLFAAQQWTAFKTAEAVSRDTRFLEAVLRIPEMMNMERAYINIRLVDQTAATSDQLAFILRQTGLVDAAIQGARERASAATDQRAVQDIGTRLLAVRVGALPAIRVKQADRPTEPVDDYLARMFAVQEAAYNLATAVQERINARQPGVGQATRLALLAWEVRDWSGRQTTTLINFAGRRLPMSGEQAETLALFKGRIEREWAAARYTAIQLNRPEISDVLARVDKGLWAGGGEAYTTYVVPNRGHLLDLDLDGFARSIRPVLDTVLALRDSGMQEAHRQSVADMRLRGIRFVAALGLLALTASTIVAATWWFDRRVVRPARQITQTIRALAAGNRDIVVPLQDRDDELGDMGRATEMLRRNALEAETNSQKILALQQARAEEKSRLLAELTQNHAELCALNEELESLATTDALTGIPNRRTFDIVLAREWRRTQREGTTLALLILDIDYFKLFNDRYGHVAGDACLAKVAGCISQALQRPGDIVARYGGEEFAVILPMTDLCGAAKVSERIIAGLAGLAIGHVGSPRGVLTISIGAASAEAPHPGEVAEELISRADAALYLAKRTGRNRICAGDLEAAGGAEERLLG